MQPSLYPILAKESMENNRGRDAARSQVLEPEGQFATQRTPFEAQGSRQLC